MNKCYSYNILSPYAIGEIGRSASLLCFGSQEKCDECIEEERKDYGAMNALQEEYE